VAEGPIDTISGVRGIIGDTMTPQIALKYGSAFGTFLGRGLVVVGGDSRSSHDSLKCAVSAGLMSVGCRVVDIGICPTPTIGMSIRHHKAKGGIGITASHNPIEWNGLKFFNKKGEFISAREYESFHTILENGHISMCNAGNTGGLAMDRGALERHVVEILSQDLLTASRIRRRKFKVVIDCVNGGGSVAGPLLLRELNCDVISLNDTPDGSFPRAPEPLPKNLKQLRRAVIDNSADIGFALDPDADRLAIVSEDGRAIGEEHTLALAVMAVLSLVRGAVVVNMSTSRMCQDVAESFGCRLFRSKVGEANVVEMMKRKRAVVGGEGNGGVILPSLHYGRDSMVGMALTLQYLADSRKRVSDAINEYPNYVILKDSGELTPDFDIKLQNMKNRLIDVPVDETDGVRVDFPDSWVHIRRSNTEPIYRIIAEAPSRSSARRLIGWIRGHLA
jgi:phosphomannomutase